jgi:GT2 family glycosyltransferase
MALMHLRYRPRLWQKLLPKSWRRNETQAHLRAGDLARALQDWKEAAASYAIVVRDEPKNGAIWTQYGHALKELGDIAGARKAYQTATEIAPDDLDARLHLARIKQQQGLAEEALCDFADILRIDPTHMDAYAAIAHGGARHKLPDNFPRAQGAQVLGDIADFTQKVAERIDRWVDISTYSIKNYNIYRQDFVINPPPSTPRISMMICIDARFSSPYFIRATLLSLLDQSDGDWRAIVIAGAVTMDHPVASLASCDQRIQFVAENGAATTTADYVLHVSAGTLLDPAAVAWFKFTAGRTRCEAAWCDSDHAAENWAQKRHYERPELWGVFDFDLMAQTRFPPPAILCRGSMALPGRAEAAERRRAMLLDASLRGAVVHIPRILASVLSIPPRADIAPPGEIDTPVWSSDPRGSPPRSGEIRGTPVTLRERAGRPAVSISPTRTGEEKMQVIIQTRDEPGMLAKAVETLLQTAARPQRIALTIVDNRSQDLQTHSYLAALQQSGRAKTLVVDAPFNWSRANNLAARESNAENIVFANNDIEMLTHGWDELVQGYLQRPDVGVVGARLLYPDGGLQHGGMLFGLGEGSPVHDGAHASPTDLGPQDRFDLTHSCVAVTGAFMAIRRTLFDLIEGFDDLALAVAYSDVDLCLRARSRGFRILYAPAIELIHHESKTRGFNVTRDKVAWDLGELRTLAMRWGEDLTTDPGYNPHWSVNRPFDGFRNPTPTQILAHIDRGACSNPWQTRSNLPV